MLCSLYHTSLQIASGLWTTFVHRVRCARTSKTPFHRYHRSMPALAPAFLLIALTLAAFSQLPVDRGNLAAAVGDIPSSPSSATSGSGGSGSVSPDIANKQCPKPPAPQYVYKSDKPWNKTFTENGKTYFNLYGKPCEGPLIKTFCTRENFCDGSLKEAKCLIEGKWSACTKPKDVQVASLNNGTASDASRLPEIGSGTTAPKPTTNPTPSPAGQNVNDAFANRPTTPTTPTTPTGATAPAATTPASTRLSEIGSGSASAPQTTGSGSAQPSGSAFTSNPSLTQQRPLTPTSGAGTAGTPTRNPQPTTPPRTFGTPLKPASFPYSAPSRAESTRTSTNSFSLLDTFVNTISNFLSGSGSSNNSRTVVVQNVINVVPTQQNTTSQQPIIVPQQVAQQSLQGNQNNSRGQNEVVTPITIPYQRLTARALDIGSASTINMTQISLRSQESAGSVLDVVLARDDSATDARAPMQQASSSVRAEPNVARDMQTGSTSIQIPATSTADSISIATTANKKDEFVGASSTRREISIVQFFHIISLPGLLDAISTRSTAILDRFLRRGAPESNVISTYIEEGIPYSPSKDTTPFPTNTSSPSETTTDESRGNVARAPSGEDRAIDQASVAAEFTQTLRKGSAWVLYVASDDPLDRQFVEDIPPSEAFKTIVPIPQVQRESGVRIDLSPITETVGKAVRAVRKVLSDTLNLVIF